MTSLRWWIAANLAWLFLFFNIERIHEPINIASFIYVLCPALAAVLVMVRGLRGRWVVALYGTALVGLLVLKGQLGYQVFGAGLPLTVSEGAALALTVFLALKISWCVDGFEEGAAEVLGISHETNPEIIAQREEEMLREIQRARRFERPLAVVAVSTNGQSTSVDVHRFIEEFQRKTVKHYLNSRVAELLSDEVKECDIVVPSGDHFLLLFPEAEESDVHRAIDNICSTTRERLGLELRAGAAFFPHEEVTLTGLVERAVSTMNSADAATVADSFERQHVVPNQQAAHHVSAGAASS